MAKQTRDLQALADLCHILGDKTRLRIIRALQEEDELNVTAICGILSLPQPTVSRHLAILRMSGLVSNRRAGKEIHYSLGDYQVGQTTSAAKNMVDGAAAVRIGPIVIGLARK